MPAFADTAITNSARWTGRILSGIVIAFLLFDGAIKLLPLPIVTETMDKMGWGASDNLARGLGLITIVCTLLYALPPTSILGAILLTGYLGGATATQVRVQDAWFIFPPILGALIWAGLYFRDERLRTLIPLNRQ